MFKAGLWFRRQVLMLLAPLAVLALVAAGCGSETSSDAGAETDAESAAQESTDSSDDGDSSDDSGGADSDDQSAGGTPPTIVVTTNILGDVVNQIVGDQAEVVTIMPVGADPHDFQPSAQEVDQLLKADALITNGLSFEEGLLDVIESAITEGVPTFQAADAVSTIEYSAGGHSDHGDEDHDDHGDEDHGDEDHDDHGDEDKDHDHDHGDEDHDDHGDEDKDHDDDHDHGDEDHGDEDHDDHGDEDKDHDDDHDDHGDEDDHDHAHDHDGDDPHFFTDPSRMSEAVEGISGFLKAEVDGLDVEALSAAVADYRAELDALDQEIAAQMAAIADDRRVLVTNHEVFGYFAERYDFETVGAVIPSGSTTGGASAGDLAELAETIEAEGVPAVFSDVSASTNLIETLAAEVGGDVAIVELYTESLGEAGSDGETYLGMVRANAQRISDALT
jgi:ABC-type Zn uptake system ZnuABC Zn-binding protein ZnuA